MKPNKKIKTKFFASPFIMFGLIFMLLLDIGIWIFILFYQSTDGRAIDDFPKFVSDMNIAFIFLVIGAGVFPVLGFIFACPKGFALYEISNVGIKSSLFKIFRKREVNWEELHEIRFFAFTTTSWLFFSKSSLEGLGYHAIIKRKDTLRIEFSRQVVKTVSSYTDKQIINLPIEFLTKND